MMMNRFKRLLIICFLLATCPTLGLGRKKKDPTTLLRSGHGALVGIVNTVKVARRDLGGVMPSVRMLAHSALLLETTDGKKYICEYMDDSRVYLTQIKPTIIYKHTPEWGTDRFEARGASGNFHFENYEWTVQHVGTHVNPSKMITPNMVKDTMKTVTGWRKYSLLMHNCHDAKEGTRKAYGWL